MKTSEKIGKLKLKTSNKPIIPVINNHTAEVMMSNFCMEYFLEFLDVRNILAINKSMADTINNPPVCISIPVLKIQKLNISIRLPGINNRKEMNASLALNRSFSNITGRS